MSGPEGAGLQGGAKPFVPGGGLVSSASARPFVPGGSGDAVLAKPFVPSGEAFVPRASASAANFGGADAAVFVPGEGRGGAGGGAGWRRRLVAAGGGSRRLSRRHHPPPRRWPL